MEERVRMGEFSAVTETAVANNWPITPLAQHYLDSYKNYIFLYCPQVAEKVFPLLL